MTTKTLPVFQRWIIALIAVITIVNFVDRSAIAFVYEPLSKEFGMTNTDLGWIGAAFGIGYMFSTFLGGVIVDRFGTIGTWALSAVLWSIATMMLSLGKGFWSFLGLRIFLGVAEGLHFPALVRTVIDWIPGPWRARATSLGLFGIPFASILGGPLVTTLADSFSWRVMFIVLGLFGVVWAALWMLLFRKESKYFFSCVSPIKKMKTPWKSILYNRTFITSCIIYFAFGYTVFFALMWLPGYLSQVHNTSLKMTGLLVVPPWTCAAACMIGGGWLADYLWKKTNSLRISRSFLMGSSLFLSGCCFIPIIFSQGLTWDLGWMSLGVGLACVLHPAIYTLNADLFGPYAGVSQGITSSCFALAGAVAPSLTGWITEHLGGFSMAFVFVILLSLSSSLMILLYQKPDREVRLVAQ